MSNYKDKVIPLFNNHNSSVHKNKHELIHEMNELLSKAIINFTILSFGEEYSRHPLYKLFKYLYKNKKYKEIFILAKYVGENGCENFTIAQFQELYDKVVLGGICENKSTQSFEETITTSDEVHK